MSDVKLKSNSTLVTPRRFEFAVGGSLGIPNPIQAETTVGVVPHSRVYLGLGLQTNFQTRWSAKAEVGIRFHPSTVLMIQPTLSGGMGQLIREGITVGRLAEKSVLQGPYYFLSPELRFLMEPSTKLGLGFYFSAGVHFEFRSGTTATPSQTISGADPHAVNVTPMVNFGLFAGTKAKKTLVKEDAPPPPPVKTPAVVENPAPLLTPKSEFDQKLERVDQEVKKVTEGMEKENAERIWKTIGHLREKITDLKDEVFYLNRGINRTNEMARIFEEIQDHLNVRKNAKLKSEDRKTLKDQLDLLSMATQPFSYDKTTEGQRELISGLSFVTLKRRFGEKILRQLGTLQKTLNNHSENETAKEVDRVLSHFMTFLQAGPDPLRMDYFQKNVAEIEGGMKTIETIETENHLSSNPNWMQLRGDLKSLQSDVALMSRELDALRNLAAIFDGPAHHFPDQVNTSVRALKTMNQGLKFLKELPQNEKYAGVTLEKLRRQYSHYFSNLSYNLGDYFIALHTAPRVKSAAERRRWSPAVMLARELLGQMSERFNHPNVGPIK